MQKKEMILECKRVKFYSSQDKDAFFEWIQKVKCITNFQGVKDTMLLSVNYDKVNDEELDNLYGLFRRYKINTKQLEVFFNETNKELLVDFKKGYSICVYPVRKNV